MVSWPMTQTAECSARAAEKSARRIVAVVNPASRRDAAAMVDALRRQAPSDVALDVRWSRAPGLTAQVTREALYGVATDAVVAVGGDGTVGEVATALYGTDVPLGVIPAGSTNVIARELGIPVNPDAAAALVFGPHALKTLDMGLCDHRAFLHIAGAGFDSRIFIDTNRALKRRIGWGAYLVAAARNLFTRPARFTIVTDDSVTEVVSPLVLVANGGSIITPALRLYPDIRSDDGWLDVLVFTATRPNQVLRSLGRLAMSGLDRSPFVIRLRARRVELIAEPPLPVQLDGDVLYETPATFRIAAGALRVIVPAR